MRRSPSISARLTLAFFASMLLVLTVTVAIVYVRQGQSELRLVDQGLMDTLDNVDGSGQKYPNLQGVEGSVQILAPPNNTIVDSVGALGPVPVLTTKQLDRALGGPYTVRLDLKNIHGKARAYARNVFGNRTAVVVGSLSGIRQGQRALLQDLLYGDSFLLLFGTLLAWMMSKRALRPVEQMRQAAAAIPVDDVSARIDLPRSEDELARLARTFNELLARLEVTVRRERRFVTDASHELRTPLALLRAEIDLALSRPREAGELRASLESLSEDVDSLVGLASDLLAVAGEARPDRSGSSLRTVVHAMHARFDDVFAARSRRLLDQVVPEIMVSIDPGSLDRVFTNAITNALRYGAGDVTIAATYDDRSGFAAITITDQGSGFPVDFLPIAFDRLTRADAQRHGSGTGLGLAIIRSLAEAVGGSAEARNGPDGGAVLMIRLPTNRDSVGSANGAGPLTVPDGAAFDDPESSRVVATLKPS